MYAVEGMMCDSCMDAVLENVHSLSGVTVVAMDLVTGGRSPLLVTSGTKLGGVFPPRTVRPGKSLDHMVTDRSESPTTP